MIFAVDFDGTLCRDAWPDIGEPNEALIRFLITARSIGDKVILNTLREEDDLTAAISWCHEKGLSFDAVNDNLPELKEKWGNNPRKISADFYIDDRNYWPSAMRDFMQNRWEACYAAEPENVIPARGEAVSEEREENNRAGV